MGLLQPGRAARRLPQFVIRTLGAKIEIASWWLLTPVLEGIGLIPQCRVVAEPPALCCGPGQSRIEQPRHTIYMFCSKNVKHVSTRASVLQHKSLAAAVADSSGGLSTCENHIDYLGTRVVQLTAAVLRRSADDSDPRVGSRLISL